ncbi:MAG: hypothetical protein ACRD3E_08835 [Terriglobales bacterium]
MAKRAILFLVAVAVIAAGIVVFILVRRGSAPSTVTLLPPADAYLYFDVAIVRRSDVFGSLPKVDFDPEYAEFVRQTGFNLERDLDEAAFALQRSPVTETQGTSPQPPEWRNTGVFTVSFDRAKVEAYLRGISKGTETYRNTTIYSIPLPGRTVRVAILDARTVAASNTDGPYVLQGIIDRHAQLTRSAPALVHDFYGQLPWGSLAWAIVRPPESGNSGTAELELPGGSFTVPAGTVVAASVRYLGSINLRAQAFAPSADAAKNMAERLGAFVSVFRTLEGAQARGNDQDVKGFFDSLHVSVDGDRAELEATVPSGFLKKLVANAPNAGLENQPATAPPNAHVEAPSPNTPRGHQHARAPR